MTMHGRWFLFVAALGLTALATLAAPAQYYGDLGDLKILKPEDKEHVKSTPPPKGAVVLFDGKSLDKWTKRDGKPAGFKLVDGDAMEVKGGDILTRDKFDGRFKLHVEFRVPNMPKASGQGRGNSG